jgi:Polysaccharide deacetylase
MSWDDGHPNDMRLADLLDKYGFKATFYVPGRFPPGGYCQKDGFDILTAPQLREVGGRFELGSHTMDHVFLEDVDVEEARRQINAGKSWLEDVLGRSVPGFCYPGGSYNDAVRRLVQEAGFTYGRTTEDLYSGVSFDPYLMPTSFHFYARGRKDFLRSFLKQPNRGARFGMFTATMVGTGFLNRLKLGLDHVCRKGGVFHLWGHSWEFGHFDGWPMLESFLQYAAERVPQDRRVTNGQLASAAQRASRGAPITAAA